MKSFRGDEQAKSNLDSNAIGLITETFYLYQHGLINGSDRSAWLSLTDVPLAAIRPQGEGAYALYAHGIVKNSRVRQEGHLRRLSAISQMIGYAWLALQVRLSHALSICTSLMSDCMFTKSRQLLREDHEVDGAASVLLSIREQWDLFQYCLLHEICEPGDLLAYRRAAPTSSVPAAACKSRTMAAKNVRPTGNKPLTQKACQLE